MNILKTVVLGILGIVLSIGILYVCYWLTKTLSYSFFYEDMVQRTIVEMVKPEYLK